MKEIGETNVNSKKEFTILVIDDQYEQRKETYEGLFLTDYESNDDYAFKILSVQEVSEFNRLLGNWKHIDAIFLDAILDGSWNNDYTYYTVLQCIEKKYPKRRTPPVFMLSKSWKEQFYLLGDVSSRISEMEKTDHPAAFYDFKHLHDVVEKANEYFEEEDEKVKKNYPLDLINLRSTIRNEIVKKNAEESVDAIIVSAVTDEKTKLYEMFQLNDDNDRHLEEDGMTYQIAQIDGRRIAFVTQTKMGLTEAARAAESAINAFDPKLLIMGGICAGDQNSIGLGSVVIPQVLYDYSTGKVIKEKENKETEFLIRDEPVTSNSKMATFFQFVDNPINADKIINEIEKAYCYGTIPEEDKKKKIVVYPMASGPVIVNSEEYFKKILERIPNYKNCAIDMEAYAFARVAEIHNKPWIVVKTVQDYANGKKSYDEKIARGYASFSSAKIIRMCINKMIECALGTN